MSVWFVTTREVIEKSYYVEANTEEQANERAIIQYPHEEEEGYEGLEITVELMEDEPCECKLINM